MSKRNSKPADPTYDVATYTFATSTAAWAFMCACDAAGIMAGYPSTDGFHRVGVSIRTWMERETVDAMAGMAPTAYAFAAC